MMARVRYLSPYGNYFCLRNQFHQRNPNFCSTYFFEKWSQFLSVPLIIIMRRIKTRLFLFCREIRIFYGMPDLKFKAWSDSKIQTELCQCHTGENLCLYLSHKQQNNSHARWNALSDLQMSTKLIWVSIIYELSVSTYTERMRLVKFKTQIIYMCICIM